MKFYEYTSVASNINCEFHFKSGLGKPCNIDLNAYKLHSIYFV